MRVLIADDDLIARKILVTVLVKWGYNPVAVSDGNEAWAVLQNTNPPKLVILDWMMPGIDGPEICRRIRELNDPDPPYIILLTAKGDKTDVVQGLDAGANDYLSKPYDNQELRARIGVGQRMLQLQAELHAAKDALAHQALHDPLTGILNRRAILETLDRELCRARRKEESLSVGLCDIDDFKTVNDTHGHLAGDEILRSVVQRIQDNLRAYDHIGRYGGEEFLLISPDSTGSSQEQLFERLRLCVAADAFTFQQQTIPVTISIGVALACPDATVEATLAKADGALYQAKQSGRNRVVIAV